MHKVEPSDYTAPIFPLSLKFERFLEELRQKTYRLIDSDNAKKWQEKLSNQIKADNLRQWLAHFDPNRLHEERYIYWVWGLLDGITVAQGLLKSSIDLYTGNDYNRSSEVMLKLLTSPYGIALIAIEALAVTLFSMIGNGYDDEKDIAQWKKIAVRTWGYCRIAIKNSKNTQRILKDLARLAEIFQLKNIFVTSTIISYMVIFSVITVATMSFSRYLGNIRKDMTCENGKTLGFIFLNKMTADEIRAKREQLKHQREVMDSAALHYALNLYNNTFLSLYLYLGPLTICVLPMPILILLILFISIYSLTHITVCLFDEYCYQTKLTITQLKVELALLDKEIDNLLAEPNDITLIKQKLDEFIKLRKKLYSHYNLSDKMLVLTGLKSGMASYRGLMALMFLLATVLSLFSLALPVALIASFVIAGAILAIGFVGYTYLKNIGQARQSYVLYQAWQDDLGELQKEITDSNISQYKQQILFNKNTGWEIQPQDASLLVIESIRMGATGCKKGIKTAFMDQMLGFLRDPNNKTKTENVVLLVIIGISSILYATVYPLREYSRTFGRSGNSPSQAKQIALDCSEDSQPKSKLEQTYHDKHRFFSPLRLSATKPPNSLVINELTSENELSPVV